MSDMLTDVRFWAQVLTDSRRTVLCSPENESRCKGYVDARGLGGLITVRASQMVPDDRLIVMDQGALDAELGRPTERFVDGERDPETTDVRNLTYPPDDLPSEPAVIRSDGALRRWNGYLWRWSERSGWCYVGPL